MAGQRAHIVVFGNEKGGSGKTTAAMHVAVALARLGKRVGAIDLDTRQQSFSRELENRGAWRERGGNSLAMPDVLPFPRSQAKSLDAAAEDEAKRLATLLAESESRFD